MADLAGDRPQVVVMVLKGVKPNGQIDLQDRQVDGSARYIFEIVAEAPANPPPVGAGGSADGRWRRRVMVLAERKGGHRTHSVGGTTYYRHTRGLMDSRFEVEPGRVDSSGRLPSCDLRGFFQEAMRLGAPQHNVVAEINYVAGGDRSEPTYVFEIPGTDIRLVFNESCSLTASM